MRKASPPGPSRRAAAGRIIGIALVAFTVLVGAAIPAAAAESMRVTFVRHAQSAGNASGNIDTSTPGPSITALGRDQAKAVVGTLGANNYDAVYASTMVRTQQTAGPMSEFLHLPIQVLPGLQEIEAGVFEGTPESEAQNGYGLYPLAWSLQGNRDLRIPGSIDGNEFDARVDGALQTIYDNGDRNAVVFSHGGAIMFWTMMNVTNLTTADKLNLLRTAALGNTDYVVIEGNPEDGWRLVNWNGQEFAEPATLGSEIQLQVRTLQRQLAAQAKNVADAFATLNPAKVLAAITQSAVEATYSVVKFAGAVHHQVAKDLAGRAEAADTEPSVAAAASTPVASAKAAVTVAAEKPAATTLATEASVTEPVTGEAPKPEVSEKADKADEGDKADKGGTGNAAAVESDKTAATTTPNGGTDLKDGNKAEPATTGTREDGPAGDKEPDAVSASVANGGDSDGGVSDDGGSDDGGSE